MVKAALLNLTQVLGVLARNRNSIAQSSHFLLLFKSFPSHPMFQEILPVSVLWLSVREECARLLKKLPDHYPLLHYVDLLPSMRTLDVYMWSRNLIDQSSHLILQRFLPIDVPWRSEQEGCARLQKRLPGYHLLLHYTDLHLVTVSLYENIIFIYFTSFLRCLPLTPWPTSTRAGRTVAFIISFNNEQVDLLFLS